MKHPEIQAVIFDMDGVIIDSEPYYREIQDQVFAELGIFVQDDEYNTFIGLGLKKMWEKIGTSRNLPFSIDDLIRINNEEIYRYFSKKQNLQPMPEFTSFLNFCLKRGQKTALASSTAGKVIEIILKKINVYDKFSIILSGEEVACGKPAPDIFLEAAGRMNIQPSRCLVIEDSFNGVQAAKSAGMYCAGLQNPNSGQQDLTAADLIIKDFTDAKLRNLL